MAEELYNANKEDNQNQTHPTPGKEPSDEEFEGAYGKQGVDTNPDEQGGNQPVAQIRSSPLKATVWENEYGNGDKSYSIELTRVYVSERDQEGNAQDFEETNSLRVQDLPVAQKIFDRLYQQLGISIERWDF